MIHHAPIHEERTDCGLPCRAPTEDEHITKLSGHDDIEGDFVRVASLDPRNVTCLACIRDLDDAPCCQCGAPGLYGEAPHLYCREHCPPELRCFACRAPILGADPPKWCARCADDGDGITADPAGAACALAY